MPPRGSASSPWAAEPPARYPGRARAPATFYPLPFLVPRRSLGMPPRGSASSCVGGRAASQMPRQSQGTRRLSTRPLPSALCLHPSAFHPSAFLPTPPAPVHRCCPSAGWPDPTHWWQYYRSESPAPGPANPLPPSGAPVLQRSLWAPSPAWSWP